MFFNNVLQYLLVCNAGLMNGFSHEAIMDIFSKWGSVVSIQLLPNRSYSFLEYDSKDDSMKAFEAVCGKPVSTNNQVEFQYSISMCKFRSS